jgi:hypothetical protein
MSHWVNLVILGQRPRLPVYPGKRTFSESVATSQKCQTRKWTSLTKVEQRTFFFILSVS